VFIVVVVEFKFDVEKILTKNPTLNDVLFVERFIRDSMEDYTRRSLIKALRGKIDLYRLNIILEYLQSVNHIVFAPNGNLVYIWNPKLSKMLRGRKLDWENES
jgi:hypothetical protein